MVSGQKKPILLFIHGYGGTGAVYFDLMKPLSQHFNVLILWRWTLTALVFVVLRNNGPFQISCLMLLSIL